jgi:glycosyltransferase involved in cell wall biosynthesis
MLITVIVTAFNAELFIKKCVDSIINQTYRELEIIIIDDGSLDDTYSIVEGILDDRILLLRKDNSGQTDSSNFAIEIATGSFFLFLDADDYLEENCINNFVMGLKNSSSENRPLIISLANQITHPDIIQLWSIFNSNSEFDLVALKKHLFQFSFNNWFLPNSAFLIPNSVGYRMIRYLTDLTLDNNYDYFTRIILAAPKIVLINNAVANYGVNLNSMSRTYSQNSIFSAILARLHAYRALNNCVEFKDFTAIRSLFVQLLLNPQIDFKFAIFILKLMSMLNLDVLKKSDLDSQKKRFVYTIFGKRFLLFVIRLFK